MESVQEKLSFTNRLIFLMQQKTNIDLGKGEKTKNAFVENQVLILCKAS